MKKIMFNDECELTQAVLSGRKTQTRRIVPESHLRQYFAWNAKHETPIDVFLIKHGLATYYIGEEIAIAQCYRDLDLSPNMVKRVLDHSKKKARNSKLADLAGWSNKMFVASEFMPHSIIITNVRVKRLKNITDTDCEAEGIYSDVDPMNPQALVYTYHGAPQWWFTPYEAFAHLIDKVSKKRVWDTNPYVYVFEFRLPVEGVDYL